MWSLLKERKRGILHLIKSIKHHFISKFPNYLIISINRFEYDVIEKRNKKNKSKIIVNPFIKIAEIEYEVYSIIIHTVQVLLLRDHHQMLDITLPFPRQNMSLIVNGFAIMILKSASSKILGRLPASWKIVKRILLTFSSTKRGSI